jgi:hypothetical protein
MTTAVITTVALLLVALVTQVETFPDLVVAKLFRFEPMPFFHSDAREAVRGSL